MSLIAIVSCTKTLPPTPDQPLGEFEEIASFVDLSKTNQFNESLLCNTWIIERVLLETYYDGVYDNTKDLGWTYPEDRFFRFDSDHTYTYGSSYGNSKGTWLYSHNYLMIDLNGNYYSYEVVKSAPGILHLKNEDYPAGKEIVPFHTDPSGKHTFFIWEYVAK